MDIDFDKAPIYFGSEPTPVGYWPVAAEFDQYIVGREVQAVETLIITSEFIDLRTDILSHARIR